MTKIKTKTKNNTLLDFADIIENKKEINAENRKYTNQERNIVYDLSFLNNVLDGNNSVKNVEKIADKKVEDSIKNTENKIKNKDNDKDKINRRLVINDHYLDNLYYLDDCRADPKSTKKLKLNSSNL